VNTLHDEKVIGGRGGIGSGGGDCKGGDGGGVKADYPGDPVSVGNQSG
jgi:hypothetical protein